MLSQDRVRVIGVCFGHQIVGRAMKVRVGRNEDGWETAVNDIQLTAKGKELFQAEKLVRSNALPGNGSRDLFHGRVYIRCIET